MSKRTEITRSGITFGAALDITAMENQMNDRIKKIKAYCITKIACIAVFMFLGINNFVFGQNWVNDTWQTFDTHPEVYRFWNGSILKINLPSPFCNQKFPYPSHNNFDCEYVIISREEALAMRCDTRLGPCDKLMDRGNSFYPGDSVLIAYTVWLDGKLAHAGVSGFHNERDSRRFDPGTWCDPDNAPGYSLSCFGKVGASSGEWDTIKRVYFAGEGGQWIAVAISPDTKNRHRGGIQLGTGNSAVQAWEVAMDECKTFSTTGNCFVFDIFFNKPNYGVTDISMQYRDFSGLLRKPKNSLLSENKATEPTTEEPEPKVATLPGGTLLVKVDAECTVIIDGEDKGTLLANSSKKFEVDSDGDHLIVCISKEAPSVRVEKIVTISGDKQKLVQMQLTDKIAQAVKEGAKLARISAVNKRLEKTLDQYIGNW